MISVHPSVSQLHIVCVMAFFASARNPSNPSECIHMANPLAFAYNMLIVCE